MKLKTGMLCAVLLLAAGCATSSDDEITYYLNKGFDNHPANEFFSMYGYAAEMYELHGGRVYRWSSVDSHVGRTSGGYYADDMTHYDAHHYHPSDHFLSSPDRHYCEGRVYTDKDDIIRDIRVMVDSTGMISPSRCSELFTRIYP